MKTVEKIVYPLISAVIMICLCYIISYRVGNDLIAPAPHEVFKEFIRIVGEKGFFKRVFSTLIRSFYGYVLSFAVALAFAVAAKSSTAIEKILYPVTVVSRAIPTMSIILLCLMWLKSGTIPIVVSFAILFPMIYSQIISVLNSSDNKIKQMMKVYKVPAAKRFFKYYLPDTTTRLYPQFVATFSFNIKLTISGEAMAYTLNSIGQSMKSANMNLETANLLSWTLTAILLSFIVELVLKALRSAVVKVKNEYRNKKTY